MCTAARISIHFRDPWDLVRAEEKKTEQSPGGTFAQSNALAVFSVAKYDALALIFGSKHQNPSSSHGARAV